MPQKFLTTRPSIGSTETLETNAINEVKKTEARTISSGPRGEGPKGLNGRANCKLLINYRNVARPRGFFTFPPKTWRQQTKLCPILKFERLSIPKGGKNWRLVPLISGAKNWFLSSYYPFPFFGRYLYNQSVVRFFTPFARLSENSKSYSS